MSASVGMVSSMVFWSLVDALRPRLVAGEEPASAVLRLVPAVSVLSLEAGLESAPPAATRAEDLVLGMMVVV